MDLRCKRCVIKCKKAVRVANGLAPARQDCSKVGMYGYATPLPIVIMNEVKNLAPRVLCWGSAKGRGYARDEILHFVHNDMG